MPTADSSWLRKVTRQRETPVSLEKRRKSAARLRAVRQQRGLTFQQVHARSQGIARKLGRKEFVIPPSRLHDLEVRGVIPSIYRVYTLARVYRCTVLQVLSWYGIPKV